MEAHRLSRLSFMLTWILGFFLSSVCTGMDEPTIKLESKVFVAFKGEDLKIKCEIKKPANTTSDQLSCFNPLDEEIYHVNIDGEGHQPETLVLRNLSLSGKYYCKYKTAKAYLFLHVRTEGYKDMVMWDYTEFSIVAVVTGALLIFSVVGSVYVFRGNWKERITDCDDADRGEKQRREERKNTETEEGNVDVAAAQSTSFYASLEPRPRSIYDVLDHSAPRKEPKDKNKPNSKKKELTKTMKETPEHQDEGVFECVYENF